MWLRTRIQILQNLGQIPGESGWKLEDEKWVFIEFKVNYMGPVLAPPTARFYEFLGTMATMPTMGQYSIVGTHADSPSGGVNTSLVIGQFTGHSNKVWRYNPQALELYLGSFVTYNGTEETKNENQYKIHEDLVLRNVFLGAKGFLLSGGGKNGYGEGRVLNKSQNNRPFEAGMVWWREI